MLYLKGLNNHVLQFDEIETKIDQAELKPAYKPTQLSYNSSGTSTKLNSITSYFTDPATILNKRTTS